MIPEERGGPEGRMREGVDGCAWGDAVALVAMLSKGKTESERNRECMKCLIA